MVPFSQSYEFLSAFPDFRVAIVYYWYVRRQGGERVVEALACGTPVVCSPAASLPEVAGDAAEFFDPLDVGI